jgi:hypothetical protein
MEGDKAQAVSFDITTKTASCPMVAYKRIKDIGIEKDT